MRRLQSQLAVPLFKEMGTLEGQLMTAGFPSTVTRCSSVAEILRKADVTDIQVYAFTSCVAVWRPPAWRQDLVGMADELPSLQKGARITAVEMQWLLACAEQRAYKPKRVEVG